MSKRLTKEDWVFGGLSSLSRFGFSSLKAGLLAKELGVSRGSFYWHFQDIADFEHQVMLAWRHQTTQSVITQLDAIASPQSRLVKLVSLAMADNLILDKAMRSWSLADKRAQTIVTEVDHQRIAYLESLLRDSKVTASEVPLRARTLYWASVGKSVVSHDANSRIDEQQIQNLVKTLLN